LLSKVLGIGLMSRNSLIDSLPSSLFAIPASSQSVASSPSHLEIHQTEVFFRSTCQTAHWRRSCSAFYIMIVRLAGHQ
jgi:hypothetical protein